VLTRVVGVRRFHAGYPEARQVVNCVSPEGFHESQWPDSHVYYVSGHWVAHGEQLYFLIRAQMYAYFYVFVFSSLCMRLAKDQCPESQQISTNIIHSFEGMRPYGALVYNALHLDRYCVTECILRTGWPSLFLGEGVYWFCLSWHQHYVWNSISFLFSGCMPLFLRIKATLKDAPNIQICNWWHYFYDHLQFPDFEFQYKNKFVIMLIKVLFDDPVRY